MNTNYILNFKHKEIFLKETGNDILKERTTSFNCGSFALNQFYWYRPYSHGDMEECLQNIRDEYDYGSLDDYDILCNLLARNFVKYMEYDVHCREISSEDELEDDEYLVAFKASYNDFHYARKFSNGQWYHKMGSQRIEPVTEEEVYSYSWWNDLSCEYGGALHLLAVKKVDFKEERIRNNKVRRRRGGVKCFG